MKTRYLSVIAAITVLTVCLGLFVFFNMENAPQETAVTTAAETRLENTGATAIPGTSTPTTSVPTTSAPTTSALTTSAPTTSTPATSAPATSVPTTSVPATSAPATSAPTTTPDTHEHIYTLWHTDKKPTCKLTGSEYSDCDICGARSERIIKANGHSYGDWTHYENSCFSEGYDEHTCSDCGKTEKANVIPAIGRHSYGDWVITQPAVYCQAGQKERTCSVCGEKQREEIPQNEHLWEVTEVITEVSCGRDGLVLKTCEICQKTKRETIPKTEEHSFSEYIETKRPTCSSEGTLFRQCSVCGRGETVKTPPNGEHRYEGAVTKQPSFTQAGLFSYSCELCGHSYTVAIPALSQSLLGGDPHRIITSNDPNNYILFAIDGSTLSLSGKLKYEGLSSLWLYSDKIPGQTSFDLQNGEYFFVQFDISAIDSEEYLNIFAHADGMKENSYRSYIYNSISIKPDGQGYAFAHSPVLETNKSAASHWLDPDGYLNENEPWLELTDEVKELSDSIVGSETDDYKKMYLLNLWVAENLYYDYDYLYGRKSELYYTPDDVAKHRYTVCEGYSRLLVALLRAQGIPALQVVTYSDGMGFDESAVNITDSNHAHVEAYLASEQRWVTMDPTWDSLNKYDNGEFIYGGVSIRYFDCSLDLFSKTHKIIIRGDWVYSEKIRAAA